MLDDEGCASFHRWARLPHESMTPLAWAMLVLLVGIVAAGLDVLIGVRKLPRLAAERPREGGGAPLVSIVVAARDEERGVEEAMGSLLAQHYPALEIVAVDDRSTDRTGAILDRLATANPAPGAGGGGSGAAGRPTLRVIHVRELPPGWLGKNHALSVGAAAARGQWLLFTDADVVMHAETVARTVRFVERSGCDHLALFPDMRMLGILLQAFVVSFLVWFTGWIRPWRVRDPRSRWFIGVGAFNLVRASAYARAGGHASIRLRPDDDLKLGKILKRSGARQEAGLGHGLIEVEWYRSIGETIRGLEKNSFAAVEYHAPLMLGAAFGYLLVGLGPLAALLFGSGPLRLFGALAAAFQLLLQARMAREARVTVRTAPLYPLTAVLFAWIIVRTLALNLSRGGIVWRGTFYSLEELRRNKV